MPEDVYKDMKIVQLTLQENIRQRYGRDVRVSLPKMQRALLTEFKHNGADNYVQHLIKKRGRKR